MADEPLLQIERKDGIALVTFAQPVALDSRRIEAMEQEFNQLLASTDSQQIILDFSSVQMIGSQALGVLLNVRRQLDETGGTLFISGVDPKLYRVFRVTQLDGLFEFFPDNESAVARFRSQES